MKITWWLRGYDAHVECLVEFFAPLSLSLHVDYEYNVEAVVLGKWFESVC